MLRVKDSSLGRNRQTDLQSVAVRASAGYYAIKEQAVCSTIASKPILSARHVRQQALQWHEGIRKGN